jgi:hypothetical protein
MSSDRFDAGAMYDEDYLFPELRDWLLAAGFATVGGHGEDARPLTAQHTRMAVVAELP